MKLMPREDFGSFFFDVATLNAALGIYVYLITGTYLRLPYSEWSRANAVCHYFTRYRKSDVAASPKDGE